MGVIIKDKIIRARQLISPDIVKGENICCSCGRYCKGENIKKIVKTNFTNFQELITTSGDVLCDGCTERLYDADMRFKPLVFRHGKKYVLQRDEVLNIISNPPDGEFVMTVPYNFKKHHWLYAGVSSKEEFCIGTDNRSVYFKTNDHPAEAITAIRTLLENNVSRSEIVSGNYSIFTESRINSLLEKCERRIENLRECGAVELFVKYTPAIKNKTKITEEFKMITQTEQQAANILAAIAYSSNIRIANGLNFWRSFFLRRINRHMHLPLSEFVSSLMSSLDCGCTSVEIASLISEIKNEDEIMREIRDKSHLLTSLAYTKIKEIKK